MPVGIGGHGDNNELAEDVMCQLCGGVRISAVDLGLLQDLGYDTDASLADRIRLRDPLTGLPWSVGSMTVAASRSSPDAWALNLATRQVRPITPLSPVRANEILVTR